MRTRGLLIRLLVPAGLVLLVGLLATLQYHWLGQVSAAERDSKKTTLRQRAESFADDFDREIARLYVALQATSPSLRGSDREAFARSYDAWVKDARYPQMVRALYLVESDAAPLQQYQPDVRTFVEVPWPDALAPIRNRDAETHETSAALDLAHTLVTMRDPVAADIPALIVPLPDIQSFTSSVRGLMSLHLGRGMLIAYLDREYLRSDVLPALAAKYFPERDADSYRFAIVDPQDRSRPILSRGLAANASLDPSKADAAVPLFSLRFDMSGQLTTRGTFFAATDGTRPKATLPVPPQTAAQSRGSVSIFVESRGATAADAVQVTPRPLGRPAWQLLLQHSAGSLDAAVTETRRRNLWLSFSILAILAAGVGLIVINAQRSQRLAAQQMDFVATVSHELRTPLTVIRSAAQNLSAGVVHDAAQAKRYGDLIESEGRRLTGMVEQVLEFAGIGGNRQSMASRPVDAGSAIKDALASCEPLLPPGDFEVAVDIAGDLPPVLADEDALRRALTNLVTNAIKYGADGRWLGVTARRASARGQDEIQISVADRGRGIEPQDLPHIFEPFYRGRQALDRQIHGNGLGLSLVKRIAEAHHGRVSVRSTPGEGATFTLHLPAATPDAATAAPHGEMTPGVISSS